MKTLEDKIEKAYDAGATVFGVRAMTGGNIVCEGALLNNSYHWEDGETTSKEINGTCAIGFDVDFGEFDANDLADMIEEVKETYGHSGEQIVIVAGEHNLDEAHNDEGEVVIRNARCIAVIQ